MNALVPADEVTAIVPAVRTALSFDEIVRLGAFIAKSGLFGMRTPEQAIALMMIASAEGNHPALAARDYDIIQGRPTKKAEAMLRDFLNAGGRVQWHQLSDNIAEATFSHPQAGAVRISWDMARVQKAGLRGKDMYTKFPRQMLRSRCVSEGVRTIWPSATGGMYVPEEAAHIDAEPIAETPPPQPPETPTDALMTLKGEEWQRHFSERVDAAQSLDELHEITSHKMVGRVLDPKYKAPTAIRSSMVDQLKQAHDRIIASAQDDAEEPTDDFPDDPIRELLAEVATMDLARLGQLSTDAAWLVRIRDATIFPPDEDRLHEAINARKQELGKQ